MPPVGGRRSLFSVSRALLLVLVLPLLSWSTAPPPAAEATSAGTQVSMTTPSSAPSLDELAHSFRTMRAEPSRFDGSDAGAAAGNSEEVDSFNGKKHQVMQALREALSRMTPLATDTVLAALGFPDLITLDPEVTRGRASQMDALSFMPGPVMPDGAESQVPDDSGEEYYLVYKWRGFHDYLWFRARGPRVEDSEWYYAPN